MSSNILKVALAQISPVWLDKEKTLVKIEASIKDASKNNCELIVFGEALLPGYPFWLALTGGAEWNTTINKELYAHYANYMDIICKLYAHYMQIILFSAVLCDAHR